MNFPSITEGFGFIGIGIIGGYRESCWHAIMQLRFDSDPLSMIVGRHALKRCSYILVILFLVVVIVMDGID